ncbi:MAG: ABC transporter ATP-binding protein [Betaproteobacteria bacterium]|nr:ABC transporter ATP-binding protein [Betaproteobacteria bacterium]NCP80782.1 ABC transporter ATP-binding protein [Rhodoferax sp.]OIP19219.1 MAG: ABC transporter ATP-binding protein [Comamonadaceae bacterium CG2_30_57_122]PIZ23187.1 MAG: ABC transporter ATP-binding protein [Comamonadaceae bacterium CG_4_10_14_0_8_um_filter_57_29]PJC15611.1 MAG: ABC transporter ATP-binding protein [Comamonadaceae bacterium CG_4_9_14_0_8_um_filter_57_21]
MPAISFQSVSKAYPSPSSSHGQAFLALDSVSLDVAAGEFFGLLGPNGAGKTTLITILAGLTKATTGHACVMGHDVQTDFAAARHALGVVPQELVFDPFFNVREALVFQSGYFGVRHNDAWIDELLGSLGLADKANVNMRALSGGMKRRVLVALALVHKPPVIVLDEPTAGVDVELRQTLWAFIAKLNKQGHTVLLTTHYLEEAEALCGRIAMLKAGKVVALDSTSALLSSASGNVLRCAVEGELPPSLQALARVTGRVVQLPAKDALTIEHYLAQLRAAGLSVHDIEIRRPDLEDVFLQVMQRAGRDMRGVP